MDLSWLSIVNNLLFIGQLAVNITVSALAIDVVRRQETLISPAPFALVIWVLIYVMEAVHVGTDLLYPKMSLYEDASHPTQLRACFALRCVFNTTWALLFVHGRAVVATTAVVFLLWLALLVLYLYTANERMASRTALDWKTYVTNALPIALYFGWITTTAFTQLAAALRDAQHGYLAVSTYVILLSAIAVLALTSLLYAEDAVVGLVAIWYFIAMASKRIALPDEVAAADLSVRACAGEAAAILTVMLVVSFVVIFISDR